MKSATEQILFDRKIEMIAKICHEANRAYQLTIGEVPSKTWSEAPEWQKDSARCGVRFHLNDPRASHSASHENWMEQKRKEGWTYGPVKDEEKKTHPCFLPWLDLPQEQRQKDVLFKSIVDTFR